jgi:hypothetical protein
MNLLAVGVVFGFLVIVGGAVYFFISRRKSQPGSLPAVGQPLFPKYKGWANLPKPDGLMGLYNTQQIVSIELVQNKTGDKVRLKLTLTSGECVFTDPTGDMADIPKQLRQILAA